MASLYRLSIEFYETLIQRETGNKIGLYFNAKNHREELKQWLSQSYFMARTVFDNVIGVTNMGTYRTDDCVPLLWPQVTYFSSDITFIDYILIFYSCIISIHIHYFFKFGSYVMVIICMIPIGYSFYFIVGTL